MWVIFGGGGFSGKQKEMAKFVAELYITRCFQFVCALPLVATEISPLICQGFGG